MPVNIADRFPSARRHRDLKSLSSTRKAHCPSTRLKRSQVISSLPCDADLSAMATCRALADSLSFLPWEALAGRFAVLGRVSPRGSRMFMWPWSRRLVEVADAFVVRDLVISCRSAVDVAVMGLSPPGCCIGSQVAHGSCISTRGSSSPASVRNVGDDNDGSLAVVGLDGFPHPMLETFAEFGRGTRADRKSLPFPSALRLCRSLV